jgi:hypothetical protein
VLGGEGGQGLSRRMDPSSSRISRSPPPREAGHRGQVEGCLGVSGREEDATGSGDQREDVPRTAELTGCRGFAGQRAHRGRAVRC